MALSKLGRVVVAAVMIIAGVSLATAPDASALNGSSAYPIDNTGSNFNGPGELGSSVATNGTIAIVGAPTATVTGGGSSGTAYAFTRTATDWKLSHQFYPFSAASGDDYGASVAFAGSYAVIGAPGDNNPGSDAGVAEVWRLSGTTWNRIAVLSPPGASAHAQFGSAVSIDGTNILIGSPGAGSGAADLFAISNNTVTWKSRVLTAGLNLSASAEFGASVDIDGTHAVIGAPENNDGAGSVYGYVHAGTLLNVQSVLTDSTSHPSGHFGVHVAFDGQYASAVETSDGESHLGVVHMYLMSGTNWFEKAPLDLIDGFAIGSDTTVDLSASLLVLGVGQSLVPYSRSGSGVWVRGTVTNSVQPGSGEDGVVAVAVSGSYAVWGSSHTQCVPNSPTDIPDQLPMGAIGTMFHSGTTWTVQSRIELPNPYVDGHFGWAVSMDGAYVVIGAPGTPGTHPGRAYLFRREPLTGDLLFQQEFDSTSNAASFGTSVSIKGAYIAIGSPGETSTGAVYVYFRSGSGTAWAQQARITPSGAVASFGQSVSMTGTYLAVGAPGDGLPNIPHAFVFFRKGAGWVQQVTISPAGILPSDAYGAAVATDGTYLVVGSPRSNFRGRVYIYQRTNITWTLKVTMDNGSQLPDIPPGDGFGSSVDLSGTRLIVGAPRSVGPSVTESGMAYVFTRPNATWSTVAKLIYPPSFTTGQHFGASVAIDGTQVVVGAPQADTGDAGGKAVEYDLVGTSWLQRATLSPGYSVTHDSACATGLDLDGGLAMVGCPQDTTVWGPRTGKAFEFS